MKKILTYDEAVQLLPDYDEIHTFRQAGPVLCGCDISKKELLNRFKEAGAIIELSGESSRSMKHGIALYNKNVNYQDEILFIETSEEKLIKFEKRLKETPKARYIDAEALKLNIQRYIIPNIDDDGTVSVENAERYFISLLDKAPAEDVAPKDEVIKELLELIPENLISESVRYDSPYGISKMCNVTMQEAEIIKEKYRKLQELRKKYIPQEKQNERN